MTESEVSPRQAAQRLGVRLGCVYALLWDGVLKGEKRDGRWFILLSSIESRLQQNRASRRAKASGLSCQMLVKQTLGTPQKRKGTI
jgi:helix-turn-helix protein